MIDPSVLQLLMGAQGGAFAGLGSGGQPMSTPPFNPNPQPPVAGQKPGMYDRILSGLFGGVPEGVDPAQAKAAQNRAMLQLGLGMMAGANRGQGLGEGAFNAYAMASKDFEGAMDKAFQSVERKRAEAKRDRERAEDLEWRKTQFGAEVADRRQRAADERDYRNRLLEVQERIAGMRGSDDAARGRVAGIEADLMARRVKRLDELEAKRASGQLTPDEQEELLALMTGARLGREQPNPYAFLSGMGGMGGMTPGAGNPLLNDPTL